MYLPPPNYRPLQTQKHHKTIHRLTSTTRFQPTSRAPLYSHILPRRARSCAKPNQNKKSHCDSPSGQTQQTGHPNLPRLLPKSRFKTNVHQGPTHKTHTKPPKTPNHAPQHPTPTKPRKVYTYPHSLRNLTIPPLRNLTPTHSAAPKTDPPNTTCRHPDAQIRQHPSAPQLAARTDNHSEIPLSNTLNSHRHLRKSTSSPTKTQRHTLTHHSDTNHTDPQCAGHSETSHDPPSEPTHPPTTSHQKQTPQTPPAATLTSRLPNLTPLRNQPPP